MLTGSLQVLSTCCKLIFTILTHIINKITIFFPVYLQFFQIFARKGHVCNYYSLCNLWTVYLSQQRRATTWRRVAGSHLGWDAAISLGLTFSSICLFLAKLTCASATALRGRQNCTESGAIFGRYAQNKCSVKLHRKLSDSLCNFFERNYLQISKSMI